MKDFAELKAEIVEACRNAGACKEEFKKLLNAKTEHQMWSVLLSNYRWCNAKKIFKFRPETFKFNKKFGGYLDVRGCDLKGITLPTSIGGSLYVRGCDLKGITLPTDVKIIR